MSIKMLLLSACSVLVLHASNGFNSEASHFVGGAAIAGGTTAIVDSYYPEYRDNRRMIGFGVSSVYIIIEQSFEYAENGKASAQLLDTAFHIAGSALGSFITDKYILLPIIKDSEKEGRTVGLAVQHNF
jgi:hypothetical protein